MSNHPVIHFEISANNLQEAGKFYHELFGWEVQLMPEMNYATFSTGSEPGGGFNPVTPDNPAGTILFYINTDNINETLQKAEALGGKTLVPPAMIPDVGLFAIFSDPTGNKIALLQPLMRT